MSQNNQIQNIILEIDTIDFIEWTPVSNMVNKMEQPLEFVNFLKRNAMGYSFSKENMLLLNSFSSSIFSSKKLLEEIEKLVDKSNQSFVLNSYFNLLKQAIQTIEQKSFEDLRLFLDNVYEDLKEKIQQEKQNPENFKEISPHKVLYFLQNYFLEKYMKNMYYEEYRKKKVDLMIDENSTDSKDSTDINQLSNFTDFIQKQQNAEKDNVIKHYIKKFAQLETSFAYFILKDNSVIQSDAEVFAYQKNAYFYRVKSIEVKKLIQMYHKAQIHPETDFDKMFAVLTPPQANEFVTIVMNKAVQEIEKGNLTNISKQILNQVSKMYDNGSLLPENIHLLKKCAIDSSIFSKKTKFYLFVGDEAFFDKFYENPKNLRYVYEGLLYSLQNNCENLTEKILQKFNGATPSYDYFDQRQIEKLLPFYDKLLNPKYPNIIKNGIGLNVVFQYKKNYTNKRSDFFKKIFAYLDVQNTGDIIDFITENVLNKETCDYLEKRNLLKTYVNLHKNNTGILNKVLSLTKNEDIIYDPNLISLAFSSHKNSSKSLYLKYLTGPQKGFDLICQTLRLDSVENIKNKALYQMIEEDPELKKDLNQRFQEKEAKQKLGKK